MKRKLAGFVLVLSLVPLTADRPAMASHEGTIETTHPIVTENFVRPCTVTYIWSGMVHIVGASVSKTCSPDSIPTDMGLQNRNAASLAGFTLNIANSDSSWHPLFGDTLRVTLDVTSVGEVDQIGLMGSRFSSQGIVDATIQAIRENAGRGVPAAKYLDLRLVGSSRYAKAARVYLVTPAADRQTYY